MAFDPSVTPTLALEALSAETYYRSVSAEVLMTHKSATFLSGEHAGRLGSRFNSPGSDPILYLAGSQTLASLESEQNSLARGVHGAFPSPRIAGAVRVSGAEVLNLTNIVVLNALGIAQAELARPATLRTTQNTAGAPTISQMIGDAIRLRKDCDGILVESWLKPTLAAGFPRPLNLVLFMDPSQPDRPRRPSVKLVVKDTSGTPGLIEQLNRRP